MKHAFEWLTTNKDALTLIGGFIAALVSAGWALFRYREERKHTKVLFEPSGARSSVKANTHTPSSVPTAPPEEDAVPSQPEHEPVLANTSSQIQEEKREPMIVVILGILASSAVGSLSGMIVSPILFFRTGGGGGILPIGLFFAITFVLFGGSFSNGFSVGCWVFLGVWFSGCAAHFAGKNHGTGYDPHGAEAVEATVVGLLSGLFAGWVFTYTVFMAAAPGFPFISARTAMVLIGGLTGLFAAPMGYAETARQVARLRS